MGNIKIKKGVFDTKLELEHAGIKAGFPSPAEDYIHETLDFNRDYIRHPEASFYGAVEGDSMKDAGIFDGDRVFRPDLKGVPVVVLSNLFRILNKFDSTTTGFPLRSGLNTRSQLTKQLSQSIMANNSYSSSL